MTTKNSLQAFVFFFVISAIAFASCAKAPEVDPNATAVAVIGPNIEGADQTAAAAESIREATITFYQTQFAGTPTAVPLPFTETLEMEFATTTRHMVLASLWTCARDGTPS